MTKIKKERKQKVENILTNIVCDILPHKWYELQPNSESFPNIKHFAYVLSLSEEERNYGGRVNQQWIDSIDAVDVAKYNSMWEEEFKKQLGLKNLPQYAFEKGYRGLIYNYSKDFAYELQVTRDMLPIPKLSKSIVDWLKAEDLRVYRYSKGMLNLHVITPYAGSDASIEYHISLNKDGEAELSILNRKSNNFSCRTNISKSIMQGLNKVMDYVEKNPEILNL